MLFVKEKIQMALVRYKPSCIRYFKNPSVSLQMFMIKSKFENYKLIENLAPEIQQKILEKDLNLIFEIKNLDQKSLDYVFLTNPTLFLFLNTENFSLELKQKMLKQSYKNISLFKEPTWYEQMICLQQYMRQTKNKRYHPCFYIKDPSISLQQHAIAENIENIKHIANPHKSVQLMVFEQDPDFACKYIRNITVEKILAYQALVS